jgi:hypothetical protein
MVVRSLKYCLVLLATLSFAGCAGMGGNMRGYGSFEQSREITQAFEAYEVNPELNYYISGSDVYPNAIMGLNKQYKLDEPLWKEVYMTPQKLQDMVQQMRKKSDELDLYLLGWSMRDKTGREIGVWYSVLFATTSIKAEEGNKVVVYRPRQNTYLKHEQGGHDRDVK